MTEKSPTLKERVHGVLAGCAVGDAMGMPTEMMSRIDIAELFPGGLHEFHATTSRDSFGRTMRAGEITDDTINTILVTQMLTESNGNVDAHLYIDRLQAWIRDNPNKSKSVAGPNTMKALDAISRGTPLECAGIFGTTNGGAMKISPIGVVRSHEHLTELIDAVEQICIPTHNTSAAIACASAVAASVSYALRGTGDLDELWEVALAAADEGERRGYPFPTASVSRRMRAVRELMSGVDADEALHQLQTFYGMGVESVETAPAALAIVTLAQGNPWEAACLAASAGGDTDTIGAIATAICGALNPREIPAKAIRTIEEVNSLDLTTLADSLTRVAA